MPITLKKVAIVPKRIVNRNPILNVTKLSNEELESLLEISRPKDHKKREFHFVTVEKEGVIFLINGLNKIVERFIRVYKVEDEFGRINQLRDIRQYALSLYMPFDNTKRGNGGFKFN